MVPAWNLGKGDTRIIKNSTNVEKTVTDWGAPAQAVAALRKNEGIIRMSRSWNRMQVVFAELAVMSLTTVAVAAAPAKP